MGHRRPFTARSSCATSHEREDAPRSSCAVNAIVDHAQLAATDLSLSAPTPKPCENSPPPPGPCLRPPWPADLGRHGADLGRDHGRSRPRARGARRLCLQRGLVAGREAGGDGVLGRHGADLGRDHGHCGSDSSGCGLGKRGRESRAGEEEKGSGGTGRRRLVSLPDLPSPNIYYS